MKRISYAVLLATFLLAITSAYAVPNIPWKFPAHTRIIYQINTAGLTSDQNIYVEMNIPQSMYDPLQDIIDTNRACWYVNTNDYQELWPVAYYFSDSNPEQREMQPYAVVSFYEYNVPQCGADAVIKLPKTIEVFVPQLDDLNVGNYFAVYEIDSNEFMLSMQYKRPDNQSVWGVYKPGHRNSICSDYGYLDGQGEYAGVALYDLNIPLNGVRHVFVSADTAVVAVVFKMKDGKEVLLALGWNGLKLPTGVFDLACRYQNTSISPHNFNDILLQLGRCGYSINDIDEIIGILTGNGPISGWSSGTYISDDLILVMSK